jgi:hypothetical protein
VPGEDYLDIILLEEFQRSLLTRLASEQEGPCSLTPLRAGHSCLRGPQDGDVRA